MLSQVSFIKHQTEENGQKQGGTTKVYSIRAAYYGFPLKNIFATAYPNVHNPCVLGQ